MGVIVRQKEKGGPWWVFLNHQGKRRSKLVGDKPTAVAVAKEYGVSLAYVKDQLGHHSISVAFDIYGHLTPGATREAVDRLDDFICSIANHQLKEID
jgi:hypothetical protein